MKIKTKLLSCVGAITWLAVAVLPCSAAGKFETQFSKDPSSFHADQYDAFRWCDWGFKEKGANCCSINKHHLGKPGHISEYRDYAIIGGTKFIAYCNFDVTLDS